MLADSVTAQIYRDHWSCSLRELRAATWQAMITMTMKLDLFRLFAALATSIGTLIERLQTCYGRRRRLRRRLAPNVFVISGELDPDQSPHANSAYHALYMVAGVD